MLKKIIRSVVVGLVGLVVVLYLTGNGFVFQLVAKVLETGRTTAGIDDYMYFDNAVLEWNALPGYNIGYADRNDTIFYISNGKIPRRDPSYNWQKTLPGNTKKTLWDSYYTTQELPQVIAPQAGYVYNANHSPFYSTSPDENPNPDDYAKAVAG